MSRPEKEHLVDLFQNASIRREAIERSVGEARPDPTKAAPMPKWRQLLLQFEQRAGKLPWRKIGKFAAVGVGCLLLVLGWQNRVLLNDHLTRMIAEATGATVQKIEVVGLTHTPPADVLQALRLKRGSSLVGFDASAARMRLEALPWVRLASVERQLPATVKVQVFEHEPLARMISGSAVVVLNPQGAKIIEDNGNQFGSLPLLQGVGAPDNAAALFALIKPHTNLLSQLREAIWVGQRRWDLRFVSGVTVMLPEGRDAEAIALLQRLEEARHVLTLNDGTVDLRLPDRIILRLPETVGLTPVTARSNTLVSGTVPTEDKPQTASTTVPSPAVPR
jgi:cell division protein FtsQ